MGQPSKAFTPEPPAATLCCTMAVPSLFSMSATKKQHEAQQKDKRGNRCRGDNLPHQSDVEELLHRRGRKFGPITRGVVSGSLSISLGVVSKVPSGAPSAYAQSYLSRAAPPNPTHPPPWLPFQSGNHWYLQGFHRSPTSKQTTGANGQCTT